ncbi:MAG: hypothetical protein EYC70_06245 [Planctomycetota bacterium]|nr:MAG: hypothetical protein EYC70_06245 [Planctomycetota bacterium]
MPFLHVTTRIEGVKHDGLLSEKGGRGFPTLMFLDAEGSILAQQEDRAVTGFETTLENVKTYLDLKTRQAKGEKGLELPLFMAELKLGLMSYQDAKSKAETFQKLSEAEKAQIAEALFDLEVRQLMDAFNPRSEEGKAAAAKLVEYAQAGKQPSPALRLNYWGLLSYIATEVNKDPDLLEKCLTNLRALPESKDFEEQLQQMEQKLQEMRKGEP